MCVCVCVAIKLKPIENYSRQTHPIYEVVKKYQPILFYRTILLCKYGLYRMKFEIDCTSV